MSRDTERLKAACAFVDTDAGRGTAYLVAPTIAVTCEHVVRYVPTGGKVTLRFPSGAQCAASVERRDEKIDCAVLKLDAPVEGVTPIPFAQGAPKDAAWEAFGFPAVTGEAMLRITGKILDPAGEDMRKIRGVVLYSEQVAAGAGGQVRGFSGSPVLVNGALVGHLCRVIEDETDPTRAELGILYAAAARDIEALLGPLMPAPKMRAQPHGSAYDPAWYVVREREERYAFSYLQSSGRPAVIWAPEFFGKTWLLKRLLASLSHDQASPAGVVLINPDLLDRKVWASFDAFLREIARQVITAVHGPKEWLEAAWKSEAGPKEKLTALMEDRVLQNRQDLLVLAIDGADAVFTLSKKIGSDERQDEFEDFFMLLRGWASMGDEPPWDKLRMILTISTTPALLNQRLTSSPFNITPPIRLDDLGDAQIKRLADLYGLGWGDAEISALREVVGGHPYLVRLVMYTAVLERAPLSTLLGDMSEALFDPYLSNYWRRLKNQPDLRDALNAIAADPNTRPDPEIYAQLEAAGLVVKAPKIGHRLRYNLYKRLLK